MDLKIKNYNGYIQQFREHHVPKRYNQIRLLDELNNKELNHYMSISNRTDGKSINYIHALLNIAIDYDLGLTFLSRNMMLRDSYKSLIEEIIEISTILERNDFTFIRSQYYIQLNYKNNPIAVISDLNNATELKYFSNFLKKFPIIIYDEFIALETDYLSDEWDRLRTIYTSIDRIAEYPLIHKPKIFYFGNAENFESPILHGMNLFNILEKHPMNEMRTYTLSNGISIALEILRNKTANEQRNTTVFGNHNDALTTAEFETNNYNIATENDRLNIKRNPREIYVKIKNDYLKIWFNRDTLEVILSIVNRIDEDYHYNVQLKDNKYNSIYLNERYFDDKHVKRIDRGYYLFENNYSKNVIASDFHGLNRLKINKLIREYLRTDNETKEIEAKEKQFKENYIEQTKKGLMKKLWG